MKGIIVLISAFLLFNTAVAQNGNGKAVLDSLIKAGLEKNPELKNAEYIVESTDYSARVAGDLPDPSFSIAAMNLPKSSLSFDETPMSGINLSVSQMIPWPGESNAKSDIAFLESKLKGLDVISRKNRISRLIAHYYFEYSYWKLAETIVIENIDLMQSLIESSETAYANGLGSAQDVLRAHTTKSRLENRLTSIIRKQLSAKIQLAQLVDNESIVERELPAYFPENLESHNYDSLEIENNPELSKADLSVSIADEKISLSRAEYWPDFMFGIDYRIRKDVPMDPVGAEDFVSAKIGFTLPLWFLGKQNNKKRSAQSSLLAARENHKAIALRIDNQLRDAVLELATYKNQIAKYEDNIAVQAEAAYESAKIAYEVGEVDFNALLSARLELLEIELERLELYKSYHQATALVKELKGKIYN